MCVHIGLAILVIIIAMNLHVISNAYYSSIMHEGEGNVNLAGIIVNGAFIYDIMMWTLLTFQFIVIILILNLYWRGK